MTTNNIKIKTFPPSGTRDFLPEEMFFRNWLFDQWKTVSREFGCLEYDAPIVEHSDLWTLKSGGTDILNEMYAFEKDGIQLALRPEVTPSLARMMMNYLPTAILPLKLFSIPQCYRFENVSKGRKREFYQWNVDFFGAESGKSEVEMFLLITTFLKRIGLTADDVVIKVSNRMIIQKVLHKLGISNENFIKTCNIIDKIEKLSRDEITKMLKNDIGMDDASIDIIFKLVSIKTIDGLIEYLSENDNTYLEMKKIFEYAEKVGIREWLSLDLSVIRGLNYYNGTVFEAFYKGNDMPRAILGGGTYDNLLESYGYNEKVPIIGFGLGDVVIMEILTSLNKLPTINFKNDYIIIPFDDTFFTDACNIATRLREKGKTVDLYLKANTHKSMSRYLKAVYSYAGRKCINTAIFVAPSEWSNKQIVVKDLLAPENSPQKQFTIDIEEYLAKI